MVREWIVWHGCIIHQDTRRGGRWVGAGLKPAPTASAGDRRTGPCLAKGSAIHGGTLAVGCWVLEQRRDVAEEDAGLGEVRHLPDERLQVDGRAGHGRGQYTVVRRSYSAGAGRNGTIASWKAGGAGNWPLLAVRRMMPVLGLYWKRKASWPATG